MTTASSNLIRVKDNEKPKLSFTNERYIAMNMINRLPKPKFLFHNCLELTQIAMMAETFRKSWSGQLTYFQLLIPIVAMISMATLIEYFYKHYLEREWDIVYDLLTDRTKDQFKKQHDILKVIIAFYLVICYEIHIDKPYAVYYVFALFSILVLIIAFEVDILLWRITFGNRIDIDKTHTIHGITTEYRPYGEVDVWDIRYFLCDVLRRDYTELHTVKELLEVHPAYLEILDRDGMSPFEIACQFASADIIQYMLDLDDKVVDYVDDMGNTHLHWACQRRTYDGPKVVSYLLEKRMSLVTVANKNGDLPIHLASDTVNICCYPRRRLADPGQQEWIEIVWRLLLAYPDCLNCVSGSTSGSNGKDIEEKKNR